MVLPSANWLMFSSRFYRRVSRQSASINYVFAFCASLIIFFCVAFAVHAQHNDLYEMIKVSSSSVMKSRNSNYDFSRWFLFPEFFNYYVCASFMIGRRWKLGKEIKVNPAADSCIIATRRFNNDYPHRIRNTLLKANGQRHKQQKLFQLLLHDIAKIKHNVNYNRLSPEKKTTKTVSLRAQQVHHQIEATFRDDQRSVIDAETLKAE